MGRQSRKEDRRTGSRKEEKRRKCVTDLAFSWQLRCSCSHTPNVTRKSGVFLFLLLLCACPIKSGVCCKGDLTLWTPTFLLGFGSSKVQQYFWWISDFKDAKTPLSLKELPFRTRTLNIYGCLKTKCLRAHSWQHFNRMPELDSCLFSSMWPGMLANRQKKNCKLVFYVWVITIEQPITSCCQSPFSG